MKYMRPADYVIELFGGVRATARAIGRDHSSVQAWKKPRSKKGTDGQVPRKAQVLILNLAKERELDITASDLLLGRYSGK